jgi:hypothetical protein
LLAAFRWERVLEPLLRFCRDPRADESKERFAQRLGGGGGGAAPRDALLFRLRRRLRLLGRSLS